ncbi:MAG TPA: hypothetical protein VGH98_20990 [Gemmatimonadaceae bacterium]|jgi:hypothetical protein
MPFGLVFLGHDGEVWTVDVRKPEMERGPRSLLFSRPSFLEPSEERAVEGVPSCWPDCTGDELRGLLEAAQGTSV